MVRTPTPTEKMNAEIKRIITHSRMRDMARGHDWTRKAVAEVAAPARNRPESFTRPRGAFEGAPPSHAKDAQERRRRRGEQMAVLLRSR